jgi:hypothetical protein
LKPEGLFIYENEMRCIDYESRIIPKKQSPGKLLKSIETGDKP